MYIFVLVIFLLSCTKASITLRCPPNTIQSDYDKKICYLFVNEPKSFDDAESYCNQKGGNLAVIPNQFVNGFLWSNALKHFGKFTYYWIGGSKRKISLDASTAMNAWCWTKNDRLMTFSNWDPTSTPIGNYTGVRFNSSLWSVIDLDVKNPLVCEIPAQFSFCDEGWTYFKQANSCFKKFAVRTHINQSSAENACIQRGGHLASIYTVEENQFIGDLTSIGVRVDGIASVFWIGAQRNDNSDNWYWTDGSKFEYANWGFTYPNQFCSAFWPDETTNVPNKINQWNGYTCNDLLLFNYLCKKPSNTVPIC